MSTSAMFHLATFFFASVVYFSIQCSAQELHTIQVVGDAKPYYLTCQELNLTCKIHPLIDDMNIVSWYVNETNITLGDRFTKGMQDCKPFSCVTLNVKCLEVTDAGNYSCRLTKIDGTEMFSESPFKLDVFDPIKVANSTGSLRQKAGGGNNTVTLWCRFKGQNIHSVTWHRKNDQENLPNHDEKNVDEYVDSVLHMKDIRDKNGTYVCSASDAKVRTSGEVHLFVLDAPHLTLQTVTATDARRVFMNWTLNDGNGENIRYSVKYFTNSSNSWQFYNEEISGKNTSCIIKNLEPNTTYWFKIQPANEHGLGADYITQVTTLDSDPYFVPEVHIKSSGPNSVNIAWDRLPAGVKKHVHFFKLLMFNEKVRKETLVNPSDYYTTYPFTELNSATTYNFSMAACNEFTNECGNYSKVVSGTTLDGLAGPPENVTVVCKYDNISHLSSVYASWAAPNQSNGEIVNYYASLTGNATYVNEDGKLSNTTFGPKSRSVKNDSRNVLFDKLPPNTNYTISISAVTRSRDNGQIAQGHCVMPPTVPNEENLQEFDWARVEERGQWLFKLKKPRLSERNGAICCFKVYIVKLKEQQTTQQLPPPESNQIYSYQYVRKAGEGAYMADIFDKDSINRDILLGDGNYVNNTSKCSQCPVSIPRGTYPPPTVVTTDKTVSSSPSPSPNSYSNYMNTKLMADTNVQNVSESENEYDVKPYDGELDRNSNYTGFVQLIVFGQDSFIPAYSRYFTILKPGPQPLDSSMSSEFVASLFRSISFQIMCGMLIISILMLMAFCLLQHYTKQVAEAQGVEMTLRNSFRHLCRSLRGSHLPVSSNPPDVMPISKAALVTAFAELAKDSDYGFEQEFEMLPDRFTDRTTKASEARENAGKNRYPDIKAYDQTRVKLSQIDGILGSDYINANFVISYKERKKFICAQGPMENTVCDFWRMIWEQHLEIVLMLTNLEEYSKTKCAKYWPDKEEEKKTYADITIHYMNEKRYSDYVVRELKMVRTTGPNRDPEERSIFQYHFLMWKDFQAPEHPSGILKFIWRVNEAYSLEKGPILVHCSAGVGRTGTLVAIDSLLQQLDSEGQVLIFNTICDLRHQRNFLVQSLKQYIFVYRALVEYAQFGNTEIKASNLKPTVEKLKQCDNGKSKTRMEEEYDKLSFTVVTHDRKSSGVSSAPDNAIKNRNQTVIPYDRNRVILTPIPGRDNSTYINASFIEGYDNTESFIISQDPIIDVTVVDFWRMVSEQNLSTIVMLSSATNDAQKKSGRYWPDDETVYGNVNVKHIQSESCPYYTRREFYIANVKTDDNLVVTQYQYNGWPTVEGEVPEVTRGLIELMDHATQHALANGAGPMLVHCECGSDRSSMFVALGILAQQLKVERRVDVVTTARKLRSQRPGMLTSFAQYEFLYRAILNYVDLHHLIDVESD